MANKNGLGPENLGPMTGRGLGNCKQGFQRPRLGMQRGYKLGRGRGACGSGFRRFDGGAYSPRPDETVDESKELTDYKNYLETELKGVMKRLESIE